MRFSLPLLLVFSGVLQSAYGQNCNSAFSTSNYTLCDGDSVCIDVTGGPLSSIGTFDFNTATLPSGWYTTTTAGFGQPCTPHPSGTDYFWSQSTTIPTPYLKTATFDISNGAVVQFDMVYGVSGQPSPCDGPDTNNEGVHLQYSIDGGATWFQLEYYSPTAGNFTNWGTYCVTIPPAAWTTQTEFRWIQLSSSSLGFDAWGLDNINIGEAINPTSVNWSNGVVGSNSICEVVNGNAEYVAYLLNNLGDTIMIDTAFVTGLPSYSQTESVAVCSGDDYLFPDGNSVSGITAPFSHISNLSTSEGCDSTITTFVDVTTLDVSTNVTQTSPNSFELSANATGVSYQWISDCGNTNIPISGATDSIFTVTSNGTYGVIINDGNCSDTSDCVVINTLQLAHQTAHDIRVWPNPTSGTIRIATELPVTQAQVQLFSPLGQSIPFELTSDANGLTLEFDGDSGLYILSLEGIGYWSLTKR